MRDPRRPSTRPLSAAAAVALVVAGCAPAAAARPPSAQAAGPQAPSGSAAVGASSALVPHPSGGWIEHARSPLVPFCHGVLIAPDVVVTSARCADDGWDELSFGVGDAGEGEAAIPVVAVVRHPLAAEEPAHALIALVLERPVDGVSPAELALTEEPPCGVELPSYQVAARGQDGERHVWSACALGDGSEDGSESTSGEVLLAMEGYPNCHGDNGAGAFLAAPQGGRDRVIGWVVGAGHLGATHPEHPVCVTSVVLATVADNLDLLGDALARSRVGSPI